MESLIVSRGRCACTTRRQSYLTHIAVQTIIIGTIVFSSTINIVSGFSVHCLICLPTQRECNQQRKGVRPLLRLQVTNCRSNDDDDFTTLELNDRISRRQTLATLAVSTGALFTSPPTAFAQSTTTNDSPGFHTTQTIATTLSSEPSSFQESLSGFVAGASLAGTKTLIKFPLDTATVRVQMPNSDYSIRDPFGLFDGCFNGISLTLLSNIPAGAVFFGVKDAVKSAIKNSDNGGISSMPRWLSTSLAVGAAMIPYWIIRNPSEVVKVRKQANIDGYKNISAIDAVKETMKSSDTDIGEGVDISQLYTGYWENVLYALPADIIKFVTYESITKGRKDLSPLEGAGAGALATTLSQLATTPLDVVRNRLMTGKNANGTRLSEEEKDNGYIGNLITLGREEGLSGLFAGATPKVGKAILSGAVQFATYEETKQSVSKKLLRR